MSENIEVSDGEDFGSLLQHKNPNYEVLNFSVRSTGLGDQIELFNGFVKKFEPNEPVPPVINIVLFAKKFIKKYVAV